MARDELPPGGTSFVGRDAQVAEARALLTAAPVVTLAGPGGAGKTRLAVELARVVREEFPDGVRLVDLAAVTPAAGPAAAVAAGFGVQNGAGDVVGLLAEQLGDRRVLLVLDTCEHLVDDVARLVSRLAAACPRLRMLCTSREPLGLGLERTVAVGPLADLADAVALFVDRARVVTPGFEAAAADGPVLAAVCERLDRLPLALELAAPWVRVMPLADVVEMAGRYDVAPGTRRDLPERQRTMRAAMDWSYRLLAAEQQAVLRRMAVFRGTFDLAAVAAVCCAESTPEPAAPTDCGALVVRLAERSLVVVERSPDGGVRYRLLNMVRDLAAERLAAAGEADATERRHLAHYGALAARVDAERRRTGSDQEVHRLVPDADNYRAALDRALERDPASALRLATALEAFWMIRSVGEGRERLLQVLERAPEPTPDRARALLVPPLVVAGGLPWERARSMIDDAIAIIAARWDVDAANDARLTLALAAFFAGRAVEALAALDDVDGGSWRHARALVYRGAVVSYLPRRSAEGRRLLADGLAAAREADDGWGAGLAAMLLGLAEARAGRPEEARDHLDAALSSRLQGGVTAAAVGGAGQLALARDPRDALTLLAAADAVRERAGVPVFPVPVAAQLAGAARTATRRVPADVVARCRRRGRGWTTEEAVTAARRRDAAPVPLTARQEQVGLLAAAGLGNRAIAERLHLSVRTVEAHMAAVLSALDLKSRVQLKDWTGLR